MATYTNIETFERDFAIPGAGQMFDRIIRRSAVIAYNYINARLASVYVMPLEEPYPAHIVDISDMLTRSISIKLQSGKSAAIQKPVKGSAKDEGELAVLMLDQLAAGISELDGIDLVARSHEAGSEL